MKVNYEDYVDFFLNEINSKTFSIYEKRFVFIFGGPYQKDSDHSFRKEFFDKASTLDNKDKYEFLYAEELFLNLSLFNSQYQYVNVALIEKISGYVVDAIIIIPESVGSYCEIGYFAHSFHLKQKILVANNHEYNESPSFLKKGIIDLINHDSLYKGDIIPLKKSECNVAEFNKALKRIKQNLSGKTINKKFFKDKYSKGKKSETNLNDYYRFRFVIFFEIIHFFRYVTFQEARDVFKKVFGSYEDDELQIYASILLTLKLIKTPYGDHEALRSTRTEGFMSSEQAVSKMSEKKMEIEEYHRKNDTQLYARFKRE